MNHKNEIQKLLEQVNFFLSQTDRIEEGDYFNYYSRVKHETELFLFHKNK
jgi:hypothetical protein